MSNFYIIYLDGINGFETWDNYEVDGTETTHKIMLEDVRAGLKELGGGHADIFDMDTDKFFEEIEI